MLEVLAYGDFSYHGASERGILFEREGAQGFQVLDKGDLTGTTSVDDPWEFLQACLKDSMYAGVRNPETFPG